MTAQEIIDQAKTEFDQQNSEGALTDAQWLTLLNEGYTDFCRYTEIKEKSSTTSVSALSSLYSLPSDFLDSRQFRWSYNRQLYPKHQKKLDYDNSGWIFEVGTPENIAYYNYNAIRLKPIPSAAGTITFRYAYIPEALSLSTELDIPQTFQDAMFYWLVANAQLMFRQIELGMERFKTYMELRSKARAQARQYQRTPDTLFSQHPVTVFNYPLFDQRYRSYR